MNDARFESLGDEQFQRFCQSLLTYEFPDLQALEVGQPDGGRDALDRLHPLREGAGSFFVFQVKYVRSSSPLKEPEKWVASALRDEIPKIRRLAERGATRYRLITNAGGSAHLDSGAVDKVNNYLAETLPLPADCWWRADLAVRVAKHPKLRWGYPDLLTPTDILKELVGRYLTEDAARRISAVQGFLAAQHSADKFVRFKQVDLQNDLLSLFIDVPASVQGTRFRGSREALALIRRLHPEKARRVAAMEAAVGAADLLFHPDSERALPSVVVEGAPGQGKSTLAQYLCQVHRMRLLRRTTELRQVPKKHSNGPARLPFKIDLRDFAAFLQGSDPYQGAPEWGGLPENYPRSLEGFLACTVLRFSGGVAFAPSDLVAVLKESHALIVFDGLDEVAEFRDRREVVDAIKVGIERLETQAIGLQTVVTSRPAAFNQSPGFSANEVPHLQLTSITPELVMEYSQRWIAARRLTQSEGRDVHRVLEAQLDQPHIRDLARNPMQLAILLTLILTKGDSLPDKRTDLYQSYLSIFFDREAAKAAIVRQHRDILFALHEYLAWRLHSEAETNSSGGSISQVDLEAEVRAYLDRQGLDVNLADKLFKGLVERVIALVSRVQGRFEFEVQPLREYFAASYLYSTAQISTGADKKTGTIIDRFDGLARNAFWLNVVRFYAGFYNSGQLPSLVFRLQAMSRDSEWTLTDRPRVLTTLFLGDWSFAAERQSRETAVELVLSDLGWRHAVSFSPLGPFAGARLGLPAGAGRSEMLDRAWELLRDTSLPEDRRYAVQMLAAVESDDGRRDWQHQLARVAGADRTSWLETGYQTGEISNLDPKDWNLLWDDDEVDDYGRRASWAVNSGFGREVEADEEKCGLLLQGMIDGRAMCHLNGDYPSWIGVLGALLIPYRLYERNFLHDMNGAVKRLARSESPASPSAQEAKRIVMSVFQSVEGGMSPLETLVEITNLCNKAWGEGWGLYRNALAWVAQKGRPDRRGRRVHIVDQKVPVISRIRYARSMGGRTSGPWWVDELQLAESAQEKMLCVTAALSWASGEALEEVLPLASDMLDELQGWELGSVLEEMTRLEWGRGAGKRINVGGQEIELVSPRAAVALARRDSKFGKRYVEKRLRRYNGRDVEVLRICLDVIGDGVICGKFVEQSDLQLLRRAYKATGGGGKDSSLIFRPFGAESMPVKVAEEIVADGVKYPLAVVQAAERRCFQEASRRQPPLRTVARERQWFTDDQRTASSGLPGS